MLHILIMLSIMSFSYPPCVSACKAAEPATKLYNVMYHQLGQYWNEVLQQSCSSMVRVSYQALCTSSLLYVKFQLQMFVSCAFA